MIKSSILAVFIIAALTLPAMALCPPGYHQEEGTIDCIEDGWHHETNTETCPNGSYYSGGGECTYNNSDE
jgi:hypothetical protein